MARDLKGESSPGEPKTGPHSGGSAGLGKALGAGKGQGLPLIFLLCLVAIGLAALVIAPIFLKGGGTDPAASAYAAIGGPFRMTDQGGKPANQGILNGKWSAVFFGYVSCPDVCPATMQTLANAQAKLGADAERFQVVFVSVDPQRDTPQLLKTYLTEPGFPPRAVGLTGTKDQVASIAKAYRVYYAYTPRTAAQGSGYDVGHSSAIYLMNPKGRMVASLTEAQGPDAIADQIRAAMRGGA